MTGEIKGLMRVDLCICTAGRGEFLSECLEAVSAMDKDLLAGHQIGLVLVVNGMAHARDLEEVRTLASHHGLDATVVHEPRRGIPFARNCAVTTALARGAEAVAFIDDDDIPDSPWLGELVKIARDEAADLVLGPWRPPASLDLPPVLSDVAFFKPPDPAAENRYGLPSWGGTYNVLIRTSLIERLASRDPESDVTILFDPSSALTGGSDTDLFVRAARAGARVRAAPRSTVVRRWEPERMTLKGVMRRAFRLGVTREMIDTRYGDPKRNRKRRRRNFRHLAVAATGLVAVRSRAAFGVQMVRIAGLCGEIHGARGGKARYYEAAV